MDNELIIENNEPLFPGKEKETSTVQRHLLLASCAAKDAGLTEEQFLEWGKTYYRLPQYSEDQSGPRDLTDETLPRLMAYLSDLEFKANIYEQCSHGEAKTEGHFRHHQKTLTRLRDFFYHQLALNDISLEAYRAYWKKYRPAKESAIDREVELEMRGFREFLERPEGEEFLQKHRVSSLL